MHDYAPDIYVYFLNKASYNVYMFITQLYDSDFEKPCFQCRSLELSSKGNLEIPPPSSASGHARSPPPVPRKGPEQSPSVTDQAGLGSREKVCMMPYLTEVKFYSPQ